MAYNIYMKKINKRFLTFGTLVLMLGFLSMYGIYAFLSTYGLQSPIILRSPVYLLRAEASIKFLGKDEKSSILDLGKIADYIYLKESTSGKNDGCRRLGLYNGYGFRQNSFEWVCYRSHEEVRALVIEWLTKNIKEGNIEEALCYYNEGRRNNGCRYTLNYVTK